MAVAFDAKMTGGNGGTGGDTQTASATTSISSTGMTVGGSATLLVACLSLQGSTTFATGMSMTWNGVSMTAGPTITNGAGNGTTSAIFYLINPATGNKTLAAAWTNNCDCYMGCVSLTGTDTSTGINAAHNQTNSVSDAVTVTTASGDATVACSCCDSNTPTSTKTIFYGASNLNPGGGGSYSLSTTGSDTHTFTYSGGTKHTAVGVHVLAGAGGGASSLWLPSLSPQRRAILAR